MVRKGWTKMDVPDGWVQIIRGPRPPAAQWPRASVQNRHPTQQVRQRGPRQNGPQRQSGTKPAAGHVPPLQGSSRPPEAVVEDAVAEVQRLEAAIAVLGESNPHARPLKDVLQAAKSRSRVPPVRRGSRLARLSSNEPSVALFERKRSSRGPSNRKTSTWRRSRTPSGGCCSCKEKQWQPHMREFQRLES